MRYRLLQPANWVLAAATLHVPSELLSCRVNAYRRSTLWIELCLRIYAICPLLKWQSSGGWVGKTIWSEFRRPRFKSWLDLLSVFPLVIEIIFKSPSYIYPNCPNHLQKGNMKTRSWELHNAQTTDLCHSVVNDLCIPMIPILMSSNGPKQLWPL